MNYVDTVKSLTDDPNTIAAAEALVKVAGPQGEILGNPDEALGSVTGPCYDFREFGQWASTHDLIEMKSVDGSKVPCLRLPTVTQAPVVATADKSAPKVWTRKPANQNEWSLRIWNDYGLSSTQKLILLGLAIEFGMEVGRTGKPFGECTTEAANSYIQGHAKIGETATRQNMSKLVTAGWLRRLDNGKGGRGGKGRAVYLPTLPS